MSDDANNSLIEQIQNTVSEYDVLREKKQEIEKHRIETQHELIVSSRKEVEKLRDFDINKSADKIREAKEETEYFLKNSREKKQFLNSDFDNAVPYFPKNLIGILAGTGQGKSTICSNLAYRALIQNQKVCIITNEENPSDIYNRITCLHKGWSYNKIVHESSDEQIQDLKKYTDVWSARTTIIDDNHNSDFPGQTTTIEGVEAIFDYLSANPNTFDLVLIDYYQGINGSKLNPKMQAWEVQEMFCNKVENLRKRINAPIVLLMQKRLGDATTDYKELIEGRKSIANRCTCIMEISAEVEHRRTAWKFHKGRWSENNGMTIHTGFDHGKYVPYNDDFIKKVQVHKRRELESELMKKINPGLNLKK